LAVVFAAMPQALPSIVLNDWNGDGVARARVKLLPNTAGQKINLYVTGTPRSRA